MRTRGGRRARNLFDSASPDPVRRRLVGGLAALTVLGAAAPARRARGAEAAATFEPSPRREWDLTVAATTIDITGRPAPATLVNDLLPAPVLRFREGDDVIVRVRNGLPEPTSIHWHGLTVPNDMDGVPGLGFEAIAPGAVFEYRLPIRQAGTYWYHSHSGHQEQTGFYGAIVIDPRQPPPYAVDRDVVLVLSDWTDQDPARILGQLKRQSDYYNTGRRTLVDLFRDAGRDGWSTTLADRATWAGMRMDPTDLADVGAPTYTYLMNGRPPAANFTARVRPGERVRLRVVNAAAMTYFDLRIPGLPLEVVAADGQDVEPVTVDELRLGPGETCDLIVVPPAEGAWTVFAQSADRSGFARATLATADGLVAAVPGPDPRPELTLADMGHMPGHRHPEGLSSHAPTEYGPSVDMRVDMPSARLDVPGVGLRGNGRRVLTYADLRSRFPDPDGREPSRTLELHLTGNMDRYLWSFNGVRYSDAEPIELAFDERVRIVLWNDTMMEHPIHLHGLWSDLEDEEGRFQVRKHTLAVQPGQKLSFRVRADAPGRWALHCHLMYHMEGGMFREVRVTGGGHE